MTFKRLCLVLAIVAVIAFVCGPAVAEDTIKIAYIDPLSGPFANVGNAGHKHFQYIPYSGTFFEKSFNYRDSHDLAKICSRRMKRC